MEPCEHGRVTVGHIFFDANATLAAFAVSSATVVKLDDYVITGGKN